VDALTLLNVGLAVVNLAVGVFQFWKEWHAHREAAHPLDPALRDIAEAIRILKPYRKDES
jgi:hypothetical protein